MQAQGKETRVSGMGVPKGTSCGGPEVCLFALSTQPSCQLLWFALPVGYYLVIFMEFKLKEIWGGDHFLYFN